MEEASSWAFSIAPFIPFGPSVSTNSAPSIASKVLRSRDMVSGIVSVSLYPLAAATKARAMPVLPLVGSMITVSLVSRPLFSASSIIAMPIRSLTLDSGLKNSHFNKISAPIPSVTLFNRTKGVRPIVSTMSLYIFPIFINAVYQVKRSGNKANTIPISWQLSACALGKLFGADV